MTKPLPWPNNSSKYWWIKSDCDIDIDHGRFDPEKDEVFTIDAYWDCVDAAKYNARFLPAPSPPDFGDEK